MSRFQRYCARGTVQWEFGKRVKRQKKKGRWVNFSTALELYARRLQEAFQQTLVTDPGPLYPPRKVLEYISIAEGVQKLVFLFSAMESGRVLFIGNGGSAAICSHYAVDFEKNGGLRTMVFTDPARITCYANDMGYDQAYAEMVKCHARSEDLLVAISSSGRSPNIVNAAKAGRRESGCSVVTMSGFGADNPLRDHGHLNFYVPSFRFSYTVPLHEYGVVETVHSMILHCVLDLLLEYRRQQHA